VRVQDVPTPGRVIAIFDADHFEVELGRLKMHVRKNQLKVLGGPGVLTVGPRTAVVRSSGAKSGTGESSAVPLEINVIGTTAEEACAQVDKFLDRAFVDGRFRLRVIHGFGKGILRKALHDLFAGHPHVEKYYAAPQHEGAGGATIVELKL